MTGNDPSWLPPLPVSVNHRKHNTTPLPIHWETHVTWEKPQQCKKVSLMHLSQENTRIWFIGSFTFQPSLYLQAQKKYYTWKSLVQFTQAEFCVRCMNSVLIGQETWAETTDFLLTGDSLTWKVKFPGSYEWTDFMNGLNSSTKFNDMDAT